MSGFLNEQALLDIRAAILGTTDTFMRSPVVFILRTARLTAFSDDRAASKQEREVTVLGLYVPGPKDIEAATSGQVDLSQGYVLCNKQDLEAAGLADDLGNLKVNPTTDTLRIGTEHLRLLGAIPLGQLDGVFSMGKFVTEKILPANK